MTHTFNPILLKELRQAVRNRFVSGALLFFLLALLAVVATVLLVNQDRSVTNPTAIFSMGSGVATGVYIILATVALLFLPAFTGIRMVLERHGEQLDLQYATTLDPARIVDGKMLACGAVFLQFAGVALPFMVLSFMLRGVNLSGVLLAFGFLACATAWINYLALLVALVPLGRFMRILFGLSLIGFIIQHLFLVIGFSMSTFLEDGFSLDFKDKDFWTGFGFAVGGALAVCAIMRVVAISFLMPPASNRARPVRIWLTGFWILWGFLTAGLAWLNRDYDLALAWVIPGAILAAVAMVMAASENPGYPRRVRREIPAGPRRRLAFPFFSGAPSGVIWALGIAAVSLSLGVWVEWLQYTPAGALCPHCGKAHGRSNDLFISLRALLAFLTITGHAVTVRLLWRLWLRRFLDHSQLWAVILFSIAMGSLLPLLAQIGSEPAMEFRGLWQFASFPAAFHDPLAIRSLLLKTGLWILIAGFPFLRELVKAYHDFRRLEPEPPPV